MKYIKFIIFIISLLSIINIWYACSPAKSKQIVEVKKPINILFIAVDDLKPLMGCYGNTDAKTPYIDKLAQQGFVFENNHCQQAVCGPSRASILTGRRPDYTQIWDLKTLIRDKRPGIITMPQYFRQQGYQTAAVGKLFDFRSVDKGGDSLSWTFPHDDAKRKKGMANDYAIAKSKVSFESNELPEEQTTDGVVTSKTIEYLRKFAKDGKPFFMATGFHKPHLPFVAHKKYWDMYDPEKLNLPAYRKAPESAPTYATQPSWELRSGYDDVPKDESVPIPLEMQKKLLHGYYACVSFVDRQIGLVIEELDRLGLRENTIIVLWGDHGYHLGDHDMWCKHTNYEQATRSPLIISLGHSVIGKTSSPTEFVDVYPTLCDLAGIPAPNYLEGTSLRPLMNKQKDKVKEYAVSQFTREKDKMGYAFRSDRYRYIVWMKDFTSTRKFEESLLVAEELYDYKVDPEERKNLVNSTDYKAIREKMKKDMIDFFNKNQQIYAK
jgi:arylsulfatase A-like enzyme